MLKSTEYNAQWIFIAGNGYGNLFVILLDFAVTLILWQWILNLKSLDTYSITINKALGGQVSGCEP